MTANFARSICLAAYLTLAACASAPTPNPAPSAKATAPAVERRQPAPPKTNTDATFALLSKADTALGAAQPKRAILLLERAVRIEPRNFELWIRLSRAHLATDNMNAAMQHARKAIALADVAVGVTTATAQAKAWLQYAEVLEYRGQKQEAASIRRRYGQQRG
jgi:tetratricopeptide (TPR) repeat protein